MTAMQQIDAQEDVERSTIVVYGREFHVSDRGLPLISLMKFATLAKKGLTTDDAEGLTQVYALLQRCIAADEWEAFEEHVDDVGTDAEGLMFIIRDAVQAIAARPTQPSSGSPVGRQPTAPSSAAGSSSLDSSVRMGDIRVQRDLEQRGRPDLALVVKKAREASTGRSSA